MLTKFDFKSFINPRNRGTIARIVAAFLASLVLLYFYVGRGSLATGSWQPESQQEHRPPPPPPRTKKPAKVLTNPYNDVDLDAVPQYERTLIIAKMSKEDTSWIQSELSDIIQKGDLATAIYIVDDPSAQLHVPKNKGHEAMVYLTYIIDHYNMLPDVAIFMHFHDATWHNNDLLDTSSSKIVRALSSEKIVRDGYMNLRCHWEPGCPSWIHPQTDSLDDHKKEEQVISQAFTQLYPNDPLPFTLAQPCCAQFAVSGDRIRRLPKQRYVELRQWLENTELEDTMSGRVFEYTWQYLFTDDPVHCRNMHLCYCDGYSICFQDEHSYVQYLDIQDTYRAFQDDLAVWKQQAKPEEGRGAFLERIIADLLKELERRKQEAFNLGSDRRTKYEILKRAWDELTAHPPGHLAEKYGHFGVDSDIV